MILASPAAAPMLLAVGEEAPDIALPDATGQAVSLRALWEAAPLVLLFIRHFG